MENIKNILSLFQLSILDAVMNLYKSCDMIRISKGKINGVKVDPDVYAAILERVKINSDIRELSGGITSQIITTINGIDRDFFVRITEDGGILLTLQREVNQCKNKCKTCKAAKRGRE